MAALYNLVAMTVSSAPGAGSSISLGNAATINGVTYLSFTSAGTPSGTTVAYSILDTGASETGTSTFLSSGPLLSGRTPTKSTNGNAAIVASSAAIILCGPRAEDVISTDLAQTFTAAQQVQALQNIGAFASSLASMGTATFGAAQVGRITADTGAGQTFTLPAAASFTNQTFIAYHQQTGTLTVTRSGADAIFGPNNWNVTSLTLPNLGDFVALQSDGGNWHVVAGTPTPLGGVSYGTQSPTAAQKTQAQLNLGFSSVIVGAVDLNTITEPGTYACQTNTVTNGPFVGGQWYLDVVVYSPDPTNYIMQRATDLGGNSGQWARTKVGGAWQAWVPVVTGGAPSSAMTAAQQAQARSNIAADFPSGTVMLFYQAAAPTGWTKLTTQNDKALRVVSGAGGVSGGTNAFSTVMAQTVVGNTTLSTAQLASHQHTVAVQLQNVAGNGIGWGTTGNPTGSTPSVDAAGSGSSHNHTITMSIQYIDLILASKN